MKVKFDGVHVGFRCPGCGDLHVLPVDRWQFNGNVDLPSIQPSIKVSSGHYAAHWKQGDACWCGKDYGFECYVCHSIVTDGKIQFCGDSTHKLSGQTIELPDLVPLDRERLLPEVSAT